MNYSHCPSCENSFSPNNPPKRLKNCQHHLCEACLPRVAKCSIDNKRVEYRRYTAKAFEVDEEFLNMILQQENKNKISPKPSKPSNPISKPEFQICLLHSKTADLVCCDDGQLICANCALFGEHKGHVIKNSQEFLQELTTYTEQVLSAFDHLKENEENLSEDIVKDYIQDEFKEARARQVKNIRSGFTKLVQKIRKAEKNAIANMDKVIKEKKEALQKQISLKDLEMRKHEWYQQIQHLGNIAQDAYSFTNLDQAIKYLDGNSSESFLLKRGEYLQLEFSTSEGLIKGKIDTEVTGLKAKFHDEDFEKIIDNCCYFGKEVENRKQGSPCGKSPCSNKVEADHRNDDDILLETENSPCKNQSHQNSIEYKDFDFTSDKKQEISPQILHKNQEQVNTISSFSVKFSDCKITESLNPSPIFLEEPARRNRSRKKSEHNIASTRSILGTVDSNGRKKRKIQIPQKYKQVFEDLKHDRCEVIDFGGAELGDSSISILCEYIEKTTRLRNLKLVRNKITDEAMKDILNACYCSKITSLNLGQNMLTQKSLQMLEQYDLGEIRNITLSLNKINRRNVKNRLEQFVKRGITLSI